MRAIRGCFSEGHMHASQTTTLVHLVKHCWSPQGCISWKWSHQTHWNTIYSISPTQPRSIYWIQYGKVQSLGFEGPTNINSQCIASYSRVHQSTSHQAVRSEIIKLFVPSVSPTQHPYHCTLWHHCFATRLWTLLGDTNAGSTIPWQCFYTMAAWNALRDWSGQPTDQQKKSPSFWSLS